MRLQVSLTLFTFLLAGCATNATVSPSNNRSLQAISPNTSAASQGGAMQRSLDAWLKEDWIPNSVAPSSQVSSPASVHVSNESVSTQNTVIVKDEAPFTLQSYADKWKAYHENKAKTTEGKPKEASHIDSIQKMPVIGK